MYQDDSLKVVFHDDEELDGLIGEPIVFRQTIHSRLESVVQLVVTASGQPHIYKTRVGGQYESRVHATVHHPLVLKGRPVYDQNGQLCMLFEYIMGEELKEETKSEEAFFKFIGGIVDRVATMGDDVPATEDWRQGGSARWFAEVERGVAEMGRAISASESKVASTDVLPRLLETGLRKGMGEFFEQPCIFCHGDLHAGHIIKTMDGIRLVDWDVSGWWPRELELANALRQWDYDPLKHVDPRAVFAECFRLAHYYAKHKHRHIDYWWHHIAGLAKKMEEAAKCM